MIVGRKFLKLMLISTAPLPPSIEEEEKSRLGLPLGSRYDYGLIYGKTS
jgi:hypothetical protein